MSARDSRPLQSSVAVVLLPLLLGLQAASAAPPRPSDAECDRLLRQSDTCIRKAMLFTDTGAKFPQTMEEIERFCVLGSSYMKCVRAYGACLKPFPRQVFTILIRNIKTLQRDTCDSEKGKREFALHSRCMTPDNLAHVQRLMDKMTMHLTFVLRNTTREQRIPFMCCSVILGKREMDSAVKRMCSGRTGSATIDYVNRMYAQVAGEAIDIGCGNKYGSEESCVREIGANGWQALKDVISDANYRPQETSFLVPLVGITRDLDSV